MGALVLPEVIVGITDASAILKPSTPQTFNSESVTEEILGPMAQVPTG